MKARLRIVLYGQSVILGVLAASFQRYPQLDVITLTSSYATLAMQQLAALIPDVIIFDANAGLPEVTFSLLQSCPELRIIGIDPGKNQARLWAGQLLSELSTSDLVDTLLS
jgi:hypothetical protein